ncbi:16S rRNA (uracil(1498)-N(3))-methyltransferase [Candidatus Woesearchaeota archaeon]|nr:16S rRNA (uracil(1498)-N(3))-methyltransferase [Candidatus Woesearchaeota archaeon]
MDFQKLDWFYSENVSLGVIKLSDDESRHLKVKRHYSDEKIVVFDGKGTIGVGNIVDKNKIKIEKIEEVADDSNLIVATAVPKGDRFDFLLQKLTELNVSEIILMKTKHSVVLPGENKIERMKRIVLEACKQSKRAFIPKIKELTNFDSVIKEKYENKIILMHGEEKLTQKSGKTLILIGPEGGFTSEEIVLAEKEGFVKASVGKNTLRIETAAIAATAILNN